MVRKCLNMQCQAPIEESLGGVLGRDVLSGRTPPRELCGKCVITLYTFYEKWDIELERMVEENDLQDVDTRKSSWG